MRPAILPLILLVLPVTACDDDDTQGQADTTVATDTTEADAGPDAEPDTGAPDTAGPDASRPPDETDLLTLLDGEEVEIVLGASRAFSFDVPANTVSITISVVGDAGGSYAIDRWHGESGTDLVASGWLAREGTGLCLSCRNRITVAQGAFAALAPNNPDATIELGRHTVSLLGYVPAVVRQDVGAVCGDGTCAFFDQFQCPETDCASAPFTGTVLVWVHAKVAGASAELPETGVLDLNLHFTGAQGLTAASAPTDATFQANLESMRTIYRQVGIELGDITYRDVDTRFQVIESMDGPESDLQELFRQSDGNRNALNLYFVDELSAGALGGLGVILGVSGGIPGPTLLQGTHRSGVAIAIKPVQGLPAGVDTTMAHETGHFLGLFHTSEQDFGGFGPQIHDPLPDTPQNDESYLMFNTGAGDKLSPWQGRVMRSNPWVRHPIATEN
ncbi:MAG: hypothetical protein IT385_22600 [Deltaproteobacteria bacterium]|nr:hypothetical protein [Deltaproteobacteria bacterium]